MKNLFLTTLLFFSISIAHSQWSYESVNNGFDDPYRIAYTTTNNHSFLKLESVDGEVSFYIAGGYYCDDYPTVELVFVVNGVNEKFTITGLKNSSSDAVFFVFDLMNSEMVDAFKKCSTLKIRLNETYCETDIYTFNMSKSTSALNYILYK